MNACPFCGSAVAPSDVTCDACGSPLSGFGLPENALLSDGKIQLERVLGQGGFGITYAARSTALGIPVAVKEFFPEGSTRRGTLLVPPTTLLGQGFQETKTRFLDEARLLAQFHHRGVVRVYDVFEDNNTAYLVMEKLEGETLGENLLRAGPLGAQQAERLALELLDALSAVHDAGLLHRDLKPDNVFLTRDGRTVLIDFGSARTFTTAQTMQHTRLVTPGYAAPEQYASSAKFGPYTDLYGLAATLYHAVTGQAPPTATDRFVGINLPPLPNTLSGGLRAAIERGMALPVAERPQTVTDFLRLVRGSDNAKTVRVDDILPPVRSRGASKPRVDAARAEPEVERVLYRAANTILTTHYVTLNQETAPLSRFTRVDLEREMIRPGANQAGNFGCLGCLGVLLLPIPVVGIPMILMAILGSFITRVGGREVYHVTLRSLRERWRVMSTSDRQEAENLLKELTKLI
jgi:serine/threonine-protein kinase